MTGDDLAGRVRRGAELLDERDPRWAHRIVVDELNLFHCNRCILGQIYGHYSDGLFQVLGLSWWRDDDDAIGANHGFNITRSEKRWFYRDRIWERLADLWRAEIRSRLAASAPTDLTVSDTLMVPEVCHVN